MVGVESMWNDIKSWGILIAIAALPALAGCQSFRSKRPSKPGDPMDVKVDAQKWADGNQEGVVERMKREREEQIQKVIEERQGFGSEPHDATAPEQVMPAPPAVIDTTSFSPSEDASAGERNTDQFQYPEPERRDMPRQTDDSHAPPKTLLERFTEWRKDGDFSPRERNASHEEELTQPKKTDQDKVSQERTGPSMDKPSATRNVRGANSNYPRMKAVIRAGRQRIALLQVDENETVQARVGDVFDLNLGGSPTEIEVVEIRENSVLTRYDGKTKVLR